MEVLVPDEAVRAPYFDELSIGDQIVGNPAVTLTSGLHATHHSIVGSRLRLSLDHTLSQSVVGRVTASPALVWDVSIGQSTGFTEHVIANLFYRGLTLRRLPSVGDTLSTTTTVVALKENRRRDARPPCGLVLLRVETADTQGRSVLDYLRCAMLPLSEGATATGHCDDVSGEEWLGNNAAKHELTADWDLSTFRDALPGKHFKDLTMGDRWRIVGSDVVTNAPELARLTGNIAAVHHDAVRAGGARLVYGGHTIGLALHQLTRALPNIVTVAQWGRCDHLNPVQEGDRLHSVVDVDSVEALQSGGGLVHLTVRVDAEAGDDRFAGTMPVLHWCVSAVMA